jgi:transcriptional regulator with XRE-family HTH domain
MSYTAKNPGAKAKSAARFLSGTQVLLDGREPGETFTQQQIADACGLSKRAIQFIEEKALRKFARGLYAIAPELFKDKMTDGQLMHNLRKMNASEHCFNGVSGVKKSQGVTRFRRRQPNGNLAKSDSMERILSDDILTLEEVARSVANQERPHLKGGLKTFKLWNFNRAQKIKAFEARQRARELEAERAAPSFETCTAVFRGERRVA